MRINLRFSLAHVLLPVVVGLAFPIVACAQESGAPELPADPRQWVNSAPLSIEGLKGKGVVLVFFEETCPRCKGMWPEKIQESLKHQGEPVVYIGVVSGTSRRDVESYSKSVRVPWPLIVDSDRSLEKKYGVGEISLQNILQTRIVDASGEISRRRPGELAEQTSVALDGAEWKVDPKGLHGSLLPAWKQVELGDYQKALPLLSRSVKSRDDEIRSGAESLQAIVLADLEKLQAELEPHEASGDIWETYKVHRRVAGRFRGYPGAEASTDQVRELAREDAVKIQLTAYSRLEAAKRLGSRGDASAVKRALAQLESLVKKYPDTDASGEAQEILDRFAEPPAAE